MFLYVSKYLYKLRMLPESKHLSQVNNDFYSVCVILGLSEFLLV